MQEWDAQGQEKFQENRRRRVEQEKAALRFELSVQRKKEREREASLAIAADDALGGIAAFERNLQRLKSEAQTAGLTVGGGAAAGGDDDAPLEALQSANAIQHLEKLAKQLPSGERTRQEAAQYVAQVKQKKETEMIARKEREQRRRKVMLDQAIGQQQMEEKRREELLLAKLLRKSSEERSMTDRIMRIREEKEQIRRNRIVRDAMFAERRERDFRESLERDAAVHARKLDEYRRAAEREKERLEEAERGRMEAKKKKHTVFCRNVVDEILHLVHRTCAFRADNQELVPMPIMREWKELFLAGVTLEVVDEEQAALEEDLAAGQLLASRVLDDVELDNYIDSQADWPRPTEEDGDVDNVLLGDMVDTLNDIVHPPPPPPVVPELPTFPLKACIVGKTYAGKSILAERLAANYQLTVLDPESVVADALQAAEKGETEPAVVGEAEAKAAGDEAAGDEVAEAAPVPTARAVLGAQVAELLRGGKPVPEALLAQLIAEAIKRIDVRSASNRQKGWILDGYPRTLEQSQLLEKELTGFEVPKATKGKKKTSKAAPAKGSKAKGAKGKKGAAADEAAAAADEDDGTPGVPSGVDIMLHLDIEDDLAVRRCVGRRLDPVTDTTYHLEFDPPTADDGPIFERLVALPNAEQLETDCHTMLTAWREEQPAMAEFLAPFKTLRAIDGSSTGDAVYEAAQEVFDALAEQRRAEMEREEAERAAAEEAARLAAEEAERERLARIEADRVRRAEIEAEAEEMRASVEKLQGETKKSKATTTEIKRLLAEIGEREAALAAIDAADADAETAEEVAAREAEEAAAREAEAAAAAQQLDEDLASILLDQWEEMEDKYCAGMKHGFRGVRKLRKAALEQLGRMRREFESFLDRPDDKQAIVDKFQASHAAIEAKVLKRVEAKEELHQRLSEMQEALWERLDDDRDDATAKVGELCANDWLEVTCTGLVDVYINLMQHELDRYFVTNQVARDFFAGMHGRVLEEADVAAHWIDVRAAEEEVAAGGKKARKTDKGDAGGKKKGGKKGAADDAVEEEPAYLKALAKALEQAMQATTLEGHDEANGGKDAKRGKKAGKDAKAGKKGKAAEAEELPPIPEATEAAEIEARLLAFRLRRLAEHGRALVGELETRHASLESGMTRGVAEQFAQQMGVVGGVVKTFQEAIESGRHVPHRLFVTRSHLTIDETSRIIAPAAEPEPSAPLEAPSADAFTCAQIVNLVEKLSVIAPAGLLRVPEFVALLMNLAGTSYGRSVLPDLWMVQPQAHLADLAALLDYHGTGHLDWHAFIVSVLPLDELPTRLALAKMRGAFEIAAAVNEDRTRVTREQFQAVDLWFEDVTDGAANDEASRAQYARVKQAIFSAFADADGLLAFRNMLLFFSVDADPIVGLGKAFRVACDDEQIGVTMEQLFDLLHHGSPADVTGNDAFSMVNLQQKWQILGLAPTDPVTFNFIKDKAISVVDLNDCVNFRFISATRFMRARK